MRIAWIALLTSALWCCARVEAAREPVQVEMRNVDLHLAPDITLHVRHLRGRFEASAQRNVPYLDDTASYSVTVDSGVVAIGLASRVQEKGVVPDPPGKVPHQGVDEPHVIPRVGLDEGHVVLSKHGGPRQEHAQAQGGDGNERNDGRSPARGVCAGAELTDGSRV